MMMRVTIPMFDAMVCCRGHVLQTQWAVCDSDQPSRLQQEVKGMWWLVQKS